ncbi:MAG: radical SAM protein [Bacteroidales bacterium]|nr:radical SAM protein [Bacteroidales bacterium]
MGIAACSICPRRCGVPRGEGFCGMPPEPVVASVCLHRGEEPPLNPIVNIFFSGCNLQCVYCQNWQISGRSSAVGSPMGVDDIADRVCRLATSGAPLLGFVTAAHYIQYVRPVVEALHRRGVEPVVVYNSGGYESAEALRSLEGVVDIYLPDLKYMDPELASACSHAPDYPEVAAAAIGEMVRQVGRGLKVDDDGVAYRGILVRHLVLPGALENTRRCLDWLADECGIRSLSLMAQYFPPRAGLAPPLDRTVTAAEYSEALDHASQAGFADIYTQELSSQTNYRPDFTHGQNPFEQ